MRLPMHVTLSLSDRLGDSGKFTRAVRGQGPILDSKLAKRTSVRIAGGGDREAIPKPQPPERLPSHSTSASSSSASIIAGCENQPGRVSVFLGALRGSPTTPLFRCLQDGHSDEFARLVVFHEEWEFAQSAVQIIVAIARGDDAAGRLWDRFGRARCVAEAPGARTI